jgi:hypothetical protein
VLEHDQTAIGLQRAPSFGERAVHVVDRAQDAREHDRIDAGVRHRQDLGARVEELDRTGRRGQSGGEPLAHPARRLGRDDSGRASEVPEVGAGPGADVEDHPGQLGQQARAARRQDGPLERPVDAVVQTTPHRPHRK